MNVKVGDKVKQSEVIALSGNTGLSGGPHLHFMVHDFPKDYRGGYRSIKPDFSEEDQKSVDDKTMKLEDFLAQRK